MCFPSLRSDKPVRRQDDFQTARNFVLRFERRFTNRFVNSSDNSGGLDLALCQAQKHSGIRFRRSPEWLYARCCHKVK